MDIPAANHRVWSDLLTGKLECEFEFLAVKLAYGRLVAQVKRDPQTLDASIAALRVLFVDTARLPVTQRDLAKFAR